jgi:hypothetical protein
VNRATYEAEPPMVEGWLKLVFSVPAWFVWTVLTALIAPPAQIDIWGDAAPTPGSPEAVAEAAAGSVLLALVLASVGTAVGLIRLLVRGPRAWLLTALFWAIVVAWATALLIARAQGW